MFVERYAFVFFEPQIKLMVATHLGGLMGIMIFYSFDYVDVFCFGAGGVSAAVGGRDALG